MSENVTEVDSDQGDGFVFIDGAPYAYDARMIVATDVDGNVSVNVMDESIALVRLNLTPDEAHWLGTKLRLAAKKARS